MIGSAVVSGLGLGSMYGLLALGFYVTYAVSRTVNFAQGSSMMLGAVSAYTFAVRLGWTFVPAAAMSLLLCAVYAVAVGLLAVRPLASRGSNAWLRATVPLGIMIGPLFKVPADMGTVFGLKAFAVAILGGITRAWGVMLAGLLLAVVEALITALLGWEYPHIRTFTLVSVALAIMPNGLFG